jgi:hypothetical protein
MGTCLTVIKIVGTTSLGLYAGAVATNLTNYEILIHVLHSANASTLNRANAVIKDKLKTTGRLLTTLGTVATSAFLLAYTQAPSVLKHPYLIYASLVAPISGLVYVALAKNDLVKYCQLEKLIQQQKKKQPKEAVVSELDNSVYKDLGDVLTTSDEDERAEDGEIEQEVEFHLSQKTAQQTLERLHLGDQINAVLATTGFIITTIGLYGDH